MHRIDLSNRLTPRKSIALIVLYEGICDESPKLSPVYVKSRFISAILLLILSIKVSLITAQVENYRVLKEQRGILNVLL